MTKKRSVPKTDHRRTGRQTERRKSLRLRYLIDELKAGIQKNRNDISLIFERIVEIQTALDDSRIASTKREERARSRSDS